MSKYSKNLKESESEKKDYWFEEIQDHKLNFLYLKNKKNSYFFIRTFLLKNYWNCTRSEGLLND